MNSGENKDFLRFGKHTEFDKDFLMQNMMGPNCVRIADELTRNADLRPNMRVLDLGCGTGLTSIFLSQEFGVTVFAADFWISPSENYKRFKRFGLDENIIPIRAEAHELPFAHEYFDAVVSVDAYHYFGAEPNYLEKYLIPLVRDKGVLAVSVPGLQKDFFNAVPEVLKPFWQHDMNFYSAGWWKELWNQSSRINIEQCFSLSCHQQAWEEWLQCDNPYAKSDVAMMEAESGHYFDTIGLIARTG